MAQDNISEAKGRQFTVGKVTQHLLSIDPCTYLVMVCIWKHKINSDTHVSSRVLILGEEQDRSHESAAESKPTTFFMNQ